MQGEQLFDVLKTFPIPSRRIFVFDGNLYHQIHITRAVGPTWHIEAQAGLCDQVIVKELLSIWLLCSMLIPDKYPDKYLSSDLQCLVGTHCNDWKLRYSCAWNYPCPRYCRCCRYYHSKSMQTLGELKWIMALHTSRRIAHCANPSHGHCQQVCPTCPSSQGWRTSSSLQPWRHVAQHDRSD